MVEQSCEDVPRLLSKAVEHLRHADEAYWDEPTGHVDQHIAYAQAAATTTLALMQVAVSSGEAQP